MLNPRWSPRTALFAAATLVVPAATGADSALSSVVRLTAAGGVNSHARWSADGGRIVFDSQRRPDRPPGHGSRTIRVIAADGGGERVLSTGPRDQAPSFSHDGRSIVFESFRDGGPQIYVMDADGGDVRRLSEGAGYHSGASFSPDDAAIVWFSGDSYDRSDIWRMARDGSAKRRLTSDPAADTYPSWSPDGRRIVFTSHRDGNTELYVMAADGSDQRRLTHHPADDSHATWAPDSRRVVFTSWRRGANGLFVLDVDSGALEALAVPQPHAYLPAWSPDGRWIVYNAPGADGNEIYRVEAPQGLPRPAPAGATAPGLAATLVTSGGANESWPTWSPDGRFLAYTSDATPDDWGDETIYLLDLQGGWEGRMRRSAADRNPHWSPVNGLLLFVTQTRDEAAQICWARADGRDTRCLSPTSALRGVPRWSPDGQEIVWAAAEGDGVDVWATAIADRSSRRLTRDAVAKSNPSLSPRGDRLVYTVRQGDRRALRAVDLASGEVTELTSGEANDDLAVFSPDGERIAFVSDRDGNSEVYLMDADGSDPRNVSQDPAFDSQPAWRPDGQALVFASKRRGNSDLVWVAVAAAPGES